jgi:hypothetical protein
MATSLAGFADLGFIPWPPFLIVNKPTHCILKNFITFANKGFELGDSTPVCFY